MALQEPSRGAGGGTCGSDPTVLFVDDEAPILEIYEAKYATAFDVRTAQSGREALQKIDKRVDFAFVDRRMPDSSGENVVRELRNRGYELPVAFLSAINPQSDPGVEYAAYLTKPTDRQEIQATVARCLAEQ